MTRATTAGDFSLSLEAPQGWVRPGEAIPILIRVQSLKGPLARSVIDTLELAANNGTLSALDLEIAFAGAADSAAVGVETRYENWVVFTAAARATPQTQGEVHAFFRGALAVLKIRIAHSPEAL